METKTFRFATEPEAWGFIEGVEYVADTSLNINGPVHDKDGDEEKPWCAVVEDTGN